MSVFDILREKLEVLKKTFATTETGPDCVGRGLCESKECPECVLIYVNKIVNQVEQEYPKTPTPDHPIPIDTQLYIQELEKRLNNDGWIPANEPPIDDSPILLSFANFSVPLVGRYDKDENGSGAYFVGDEDVPLVKQNIFVNAWQPLPKCYQTQEGA